MTHLLTKKAPKMKQVGNNVSAAAATELTGGH